MMTMVVPKLVEIFEGKDSLPRSTQILMGVSNFFVHYWILVIFGIIVSVIGFIFWKKLPSGKYSYDNFLFMIPVFGDINRKLVLSKFSRIF